MCLYLDKYGLPGPWTPVSKTAQDHLGQLQGEVEEEGHEAHGIG